MGSEARLVEYVQARRRHFLRAPGANVVSKGEGVALVRANAGIVRAERRLPGRLMQSQPRQQGGRFLWE